jgi:hypothetical protein
LCNWRLKWVGHNPTINKIESSVFRLRKVATPSSSFEIGAQISAST